MEIIAIGGTMARDAATFAKAEYKSGQMGVDTLIKAVPTLNKGARVSGEHTLGLLQRRFRYQPSTRGHSLYLRRQSGRPRGRSGQSGCQRGTVSAGVANRNMPNAVMDVLGRAAKGWVDVVRASRITLDLWSAKSKSNDGKLKFVAAEELNPHRPA